MKTRKEKEKVTSGGAYTVEQFRKFMQKEKAKSVEYTIVKSAGKYVVTINDSGNGKFRFSQRQFVDEDLQQIRNEIRNYLDSHKVKARRK